jgi:hypothetical protein
VAGFNPGGGEKRFHIVQPFGKVLRCFSQCIVVAGQSFDLLGVELGIAILLLSGLQFVLITLQVKLQVNLYYRFPRTATPRIGIRSGFVVASSDRECYLTGLR